MYENKKAQLRQVFVVIDINNDKKVTPEEFNKYMVE